MEENVKSRIDKRRKSMEKRERIEIIENEEREALASRIRPQLLKLAARLSPEAFLKQCMPNLRVDENIKGSLKRALAKLHPDRARHLPTLKEKVEAEEMYKVVLCYYESK